MERFRTKDYSEHFNNTQFNAIDIDGQSMISAPSKAINSSINEDDDEVHLIDTFEFAPDNIFNKKMPKTSRTS